MVLYENHLFFDTQNAIAATVEFAGAEFIKIGGDFCTSLQAESLVPSCARKPSCR
jgi:hypothetical protein